jgi:invasion protein IalB
MIASTGLRRLAIAGGVVAAVATVIVFAPVRAQQTPDQFPPSQEPQLDLPQTQQPETPERYGDWTRQCKTQSGSQEQRCYLSQMVTVQQDDKRHPVLLMAVGYYGEKKMPRVIFRMPLALGIYLPEGLTLSVPNIKPLRVVFETCLPGGCSGSLPLSEDVLAAIKKANGGTVGVQNVRKQKLQLPVSFKGFTAGFAALDKG